jgi:hypothetical protein
VANTRSSLSASSTAGAYSSRRLSEGGDQSSKLLRARLAKECAHLGLEVDARGSLYSSSSRRRSLAAAAAAADDATGMAAAAAAATVAAAAATAAHTALIAAAARPTGLLSNYCADVAEWQQQQQHQQLAVERRSTVH